LCAERLGPFLRVEIQHHIAEPVHMQHRRLDAVFRAYRFAPDRGVQCGHVHRIAEGADVLAQRQSCAKRRNKVPAVEGVAEGGQIQISAHTLRINGDQAVPGVVFGGKRQKAVVRSDADALRGIQAKERAIGTHAGIDDNQADSPRGVVGQAADQEERAGAHIVLGYGMRKVKYRRIRRQPVQDAADLAHIGIDASQIRQQDDIWLHEWRAFGGFWEMGVFHRSVLAVQ